MTIQANIHPCREFSLDVQMSAELYIWKLCRHLILLQWELMLSGNWDGSYRTAQREEVCGSAVHHSTQNSAHWVELVVCCKVILSPRIIVNFWFIVLFGSIRVEEWMNVKGVQGMVLDVLTSHLGWKLCTSWVRWVWGRGWELWTKRGVWGEQRLKSIV